MEKLSNRKCWYCEGATARFDFHVDHYRPKNRVINRDGSKGPGYFWLAFDHRNFRLSCAYCNSPHTGNGDTLGKANQFPLAPGSIMALLPDSNIDDEVPLLLDPTRTSDYLLLWFLDTGEACPSSPNGLPHRRAQETIIVLNLNHYLIMEQRRKLWNDVIGLVESTNRVYEQYKNGSPAAFQEFNRAVERICGLVSRSAEFSATARACLRGFAYPWVRALLALS